LTDCSKTCCPKSPSAHKAVGGFQGPSPPKGINPIGLNTGSPCIGCCEHMASHQIDVERRSLLFSFLF